jgi:UDP-glucuronate 4-epimerase
MKILVTGCCGFIGMHLSQELLKKYDVIGIDNINPYYDVNLKKHRLEILKRNKNFSFFKVDINNYKKLNLIFKKTRPKIVLHLAAEVGVRYSLTHPRKYINSNLVGFFNILENCNNFKIKKLFYASSSSVYGDSYKKSLKENLVIDKQLSIYAATKRASEIIANSYSYLYSFPIIGLRFFTVYGPYGRPDMAIFKYTDLIYKKKMIEIYDGGNLQRDFTYIDDLVYYIKNMINRKFPKTHQIYNIGNNKPIKVSKIVSLIENALNIKAKKKFTNAPKTEVERTSANLSKLNNLIVLKKKTSIKNGINNFVSWYIKFNQNR